MRSLKSVINTRKGLALALIVLMMNPGQLYASDGDLDTSFGLAGKVTTDFLSLMDSASDLIIQSDGKIVAGGYASISMLNIRSGHRSFALARYNSDGSPDIGFGAGGRVTTAF